MVHLIATHLGVAADHVIGSFRNGLWEYKRRAGIERALNLLFAGLMSKML